MTSDFRAIHEAGHAVVTLAVGGDIDFATIIGDPGRNGGQVACTNLSNKRFAVALWAGIHAENMVTRKTDHDHVRYEHGASDLDQLYRLPAPENRHGGPPRALCGRLGQQPDRRSRKSPAPLALRPRVLIFITGLAAHRGHAPALIGTGHRSGRPVNETDLFCQRRGHRDTCSWLLIDHQGGQRPHRLGTTGYGLTRHDRLFLDDTGTHDGSPNHDGSSNHDAPYCRSNNGVACCGIDGIDAASLVVRRHALRCHPQRHP